MLGMEGFLGPINNLKPPLPLFKYEDDVTAMGVIRKTDTKENHLQETVGITVKWTKDNDMRINA